MGHIHAKVRTGTVLFLCALALASMFPLLADARGDRSGRADVIERLCERQDWLGSRLKRAIIDPEICDPPPPPAEPTLTLTATPATITEGESTMLAWDSSDATSCTASGAWSGAKTVDGDESITPAASATYSLECSGPGGSISKSVSVTVNPAPAQPTITVVKTIVNDDGGEADQSDFQARIDGIAVAWSTAITVTPGAHTVSEDIATGYTASTWGGDCASNGSITVALGENKTCTITNDDNEPVIQPTITDLVVADDRFDTLEAAVVAAGLADDLAGTGPFTVFAPTDDAFGALPEGALDALLADIPALTDVLLYHVASGKKMAAEVVLADTLETLLGETVDITVNDDGVFVNDAEIIVTDIEAINGVVHVIDAVLTPPADEPSGDLLITEVLYDTGAGQGSEPGNAWVEIHNGTDSAIDLSGYAINDGTGSDVLPEGTMLAAGGYLIVTATSTTANFWTFPEGTVVVSLGSSIGSNGLGNTGDRVELRNASSELIDAVSWGTDVSAFSPSVAGVDAGHSLSRVGADTDTAVDWADEDTPNPGA